MESARQQTPAPEVRVIGARTMIKKRTDDGVQTNGPDHKMLVLEPRRLSHIYYIYIYMYIECHIGII